MRSDPSRLCGRRNQADYIEGTLLTSPGGDCGVCLEAIAIAAGLEDVAAVGEVIEECGGHLGIAVVHMLYRAAFIIGITIVTITGIKPSGACIVHLPSGVGLYSTATETIFSVRSPFSKNN